MIPILTVISNALGIFGAGLISVFSLKLSWAVLLAHRRATPWASTTSSWAFRSRSSSGSSSLRWAATWASPPGAGRRGWAVSTTRSVVVASVLILVADFFMTKVLLLAFPVS